MLPFRARVDLGAEAMKWVPRIPQSSSITGTSPSDCLVSYQGHSLGESYPSAEVQSVYSTAPANWTTGHSLGESYPSAEVQSVYSTAPADWVRIKSNKKYLKLTKRIIPHLYLSLYLSISLSVHIWCTYFSRSLMSSFFYSLFSPEHSLYIYIYICVCVCVRVCVEKIYL